MACLVFDSLVDAGAPPDNHRLRFEHPRLTVDLALSIDRGKARMSGTARPPGPHTAAVHFDGRDLEILARVVAGKFPFDPVDLGLVRLSLTDGRDTVWTDWFRL